MTRQMNEITEIERQIAARGFRPEGVWELLKAVLGSKGIGINGKPRKNFAPVEHRYETRERTHILRKLYSKDRKGVLACYECGAPISGRSICPECGRDNHYAVLLGVCKVLEE